MPPAPKPTTASSAPKQQPAGDTSVATLNASASTVRGLAWAENLGWVTALIGGGLAVFSLWWTTENWPENFNPGGVSGFNIGLVLFALGIVLGKLFSYVPGRRPSGFDAEADRDHWIYEAAVAAQYRRMSRLLSQIGIGLAVAGLIGAMLVYRLWIQGGGPAAPKLNWLGSETAHSTWAFIFLGVAALGLVLWIAFAARAQAFSYALRGCVAASSRQNGAPGSPSPKVGQGPTSASRGPPSGLASNEVVALVKRLDQLLATLPDDAVASFSKSPEAETYLKILGGK